MIIPARAVLPVIAFITTLAASRTAPAVKF